MNFAVIPAIDLIGGRCVRLTRGEYSAETVYDDDPVQVARRWKEAGAQRLHIVDLDGARQGSPCHLDTLRAIVEATGSPVQYGGGLRRPEDVQQVLDAGARWAILGTGAVMQPHFLDDCARQWPDRILVSLDLRDGKLAVKGWLESSGVPLEDVLERLRRLRLSEVIVTDVGRDGTLSGVGDHVAAQVAAAGFRVIAAGGVREIKDLSILRQWAPNDGNTAGVCGVVVGKAIYAGTLDLRRALTLMEKEGR